MTARTARLVDGPIGPTLVGLTAPMLIAHYAMIAFNLVDTAYLGRLGTAELAAISFTFPVVMIIASISQGLGTGMSATISQAIGSGDDSRVQRLTTHGLGLAVMAVVAFSIAGLLTIDPVFRLLGAGDETLPLIRDYMVLWYLGMVVLIVPMTGNYAIRATGDTRTPAIIMTTSAFINLVLDPLLIFGLGPFPELGIQGAALATVFARSVSLTASLYVLVRRERMVKLARLRWHELWESWRAILFVGVPAAATQLLLPLSIAVTTWLVASHGQHAVAALGVASRVELFGFGVVVALGVTLTPFVGQNWGADRTDRLARAIRLAQRFAVVWGAALFVVFALLGGPIARLFTDDIGVISVVQDYLLIAPIGYGLLAVLMVSSSALNALHRPIHSAVLSAGRLFVLYVPLAILGSMALGLNGVFAAMAVANVIGGVAAWLVVKHRVGQLSGSNSSVTQRIST